MKELTANEAAGIRIKTKPKISTGLCAFAIVMILSGNAALMIPGLIFALAVLIVVFSIQDETCARIGAEEIVLLPEKAQAETVIPFCEVAEWNTRDGIRIRTLSGEIYFIETRDTMKAHRLLHRRMPELKHPLSFSGSWGKEIEDTPPGLSVNRVQLKLSERKLKSDDRA